MSDSKEGDQTPMNEKESVTTAWKNFLLFINGKITEEEYNENNRLIKKYRAMGAKKPKTR